MKAEDKVLQAYFISKSHRLYYSQLKEISALSHSSLQNTLKQLIAKKILKEDKQKSNVFYEILNKKLFSLKFSEIALQKFKVLNRGVRIPLQEFLTTLPKDIFSIVLFGSASKNEEKRGSDIDILIVSKERYNFEEEVKNTNIVSNYPLNLFHCSVTEFIEGTDHIIIQAKKTGFPIKGEQNFYEVLLDEY